GFADSGFLSRLNQVVTGQEPRGSSVELTLDPAVQRAAYDAMVGMGFSGAVVAVEPDTGRLLALVSTPGFDANAIAVHDSEQAQAAYDQLEGDELHPLVNKALRQTYQPGSIFKIVVAAAALESGDFTPDSTFDNPAEYTLPGSGTTIYTATRGTCGGLRPDEVTLAETIEYSCNIPMAQLADELGAEAIREQAERFGFGSEFEVPLTSVPSVYDPSGAAQTAQSGYGQNRVLSTPLQAAMWTAAIANG